MNDRQRTYFQREIRRLMEAGEVRKMERFIQHGSVTCLSHSLDVARGSYALACLLRLHVDSRALIRGALLHDYFLYDWHEKDKSHRLHGFRHPGFALKNARRHFNLSPIEEEIIRKHMWPLTIIPPTCREAAIVCLVDKYCSTRETVYGFRNRLLRSSAV